ncbi:VCBS domain-containing protein [Bradyrhizobium sp.]|uniref:VCBS domain-containing protein n=1 Tax=Bradyrhizobium sp. TaxID=376 RepID=UPI002735B083|nr:VCBS domain-containing protein [Bradyrhizobium sp.]MDP3078720.1 VCBS domain-containing protein [Bradyrhizobium sp.]
MNFAGKFGSGTPDNFSSAGFKIDALGHQGGGDSVTIPDAHLLFSGDYSRSGADLIVSDQLHRVVVSNYFQGDKRPTLLSPDGAPLDPGFIEAMTGHVQYAQAASTAAAAAAKVVGHVVKMTGSASVVRNGVTVALNNGDTVLQNDVVQTGSGSSLGLVMIDGTTFNLSAGARLMLNDLTYDASSTANSSLFTLVQGAASFVAGQVAKTGDMKVGTPVATMGIRGTAVILDISAVDGKVSISVIDQRDGQVHSVQVFNSRGVLIGTVTSNGTTLTLTPIANFEVIAQESNKTVAQIAQEFAIFREALSLYEIQKAIDPNLPQHTENNTANPRQYASAGSTPANPLAPEYIPVSGNAPASSGDGAPVTVELNLPTPGQVPTGIPTPPPSPGAPIVVTVVIPPAPLPFVVTPPTVNQISGPGGDHFGPVMSADGQFIVYDPDGTIFLYEHQTHTTITIAEAGNGFSYSGQTISADGRTVVFQGTDGTQSWVFIYNNDPSDTAHYQQTTQLTAGGAPAVSGDGSRIVVEHGGNSIGIYDPQGHVIATITAAAIGETGAVWLPAISAGGQMIAFWQTDAAEPGGSGQLFVYDLATGAATAIAGTATDAGMSAASFSADGRYVVYQSDAPGGHSEIYLYDLSTGQVVFHTANASGASYNPVISPDGNFIIFASDAQFAGDGNAVTDTYLVDISDPANPVYTRVSNLANGNQPDAVANLGATISAGGLYIAFASSAAPGTGDIFLADPTSGRSAIIQERASSPAILTAAGVIELTGDNNGATLSVANPNGRFTASFNANGDIVWNFSEPKSDFAALLPGQKVTQDFIILLTNDSGTMQIPVRVVVYDADLPVTVAVANPGTIAGDNNDNVLTGTAGNDILQGFGGNDTLIGLTGVDRAVYTDATSGITVNLAAGMVTGQGVGTDTLQFVEAVQGSNFADTYSATGFTGSSGLPGVPVGFNSFEGMAGDDIVTGNVNVQGQALTRISYASASAAVTVDMATGTATGNASVGTDHFTNVSTVIGSRFGDALRGSDNEDGSFEQFDGRGGNDTIDGRGGYDFAAYNNDPATRSGITVNLAAGSVVGDASIGSDILYSVEGVRGTHFADTYNAVGFNGASTNAGSLGFFNSFDGQDGNDSITGNGNTRIQYSQSTAAVFVDLANTAAGGTGLARDRADALNLTNLDLASVGIDVIYGGVNAVMGSMFGDTLLGSANNEQFMGLAGDDFINGRGGFDIAQYNNMTHTTGGISVDFTLGTVTGDASTGTDTLRGIEGVQGTNFADSFDATGFGNSDHLDAALFNVGNNGTYNQFEGLAGNDTITGNGNTRVIYFNAEAAVTVDIADGTADGDASVGHDVFSGVNGVGGSDFADILRGSNNAQGTIEQFDARGGDDTIDGRGGFDQAIYSNDPNVTTGITVDMFAGTVDGDASVGHDTLVFIESVIGTRFGDIYDALNFVGFNEFQGLGGDDQITGNGTTQLGYYNATSGVTVDMKLGTADGDASVGHDIFDGVNQVRGSSFGDNFTGDDDNNILDGLGGNDRLDGSGGDDDLYGGAGADTFVYTTGIDTVHDFNRSEGDRIDLTGVAGVHSLADLADLIAVTEGNNTLIDFGERGTLDLRGVTTLVESDFIFAAPPVNAAPDFTGNDLEATYTGAAVAIAGDVTASDIDSDDYDGGSLTATVTAGGSEGDTLSIAESEYIQFAISGNVVSYDSDGEGGDADFVSIGTLTNNFNSLTIAFNDNATDDAVAALTQAIQFSNAKSNVAPGTRTVTFTLDDGGGTANGGHNTDYFTATVDVEADGHPATFGGDTTGEVTEDDTTIPSGSIHGHDFDDGTLTVQDADSGESYFQAVAPTALVGTYGDFTFDHTTGDWTYALVHVRVDGLAAGEVQYDTLMVTSADGTTQDIVVTVNGANEKPEFTAANPAATFAAGGGSVAVVSGVSVSDIDSDDYGGGSLSATVWNSSSGDRLSIGGNAFISVAAVASGQVVMFDADGGGAGLAVEIGTLSDNGDSLTVYLNDNATDDAVDALAEAIRFENNNSYPDIGLRTVTFALNDGDGSDAFEATVDVVAPPSNQAPVAGPDNVLVRPDYLAIASTLITNDSDPDEHPFVISGAAYGENEATLDDGIYTIEGQYGTLKLFATEHESVTFGGFENFHVYAGNFIYAIGQDANDEPIPGVPIYDLQPGQTLSEEFTYTITDSYGAISSPATVTVTFEPSLVDLRVHTTEGYDTTTLWNDLYNGTITAIDETHITVVNDGRTIEIDAKDLMFTLGSGEYSIDSGLIKGFHVTGPSGPLFDAVRYNLPAGLLDAAVDSHDSTEFDNMLAEYGHDSHGSVGADVLRGGDLVDYFDTGGGADTIVAGGGNDVVTISDNAAWNIDGGDGVDTVKLSGAFNLAAGPEGQNLTSIEIVDLNTTDANAVIVEPEDVFELNADGVVRILGNSSDNVVLAGHFTGHPDGQWFPMATEIFYQGDNATAGVSFDMYEYKDGEETLATLYVEHGVPVDSGPVILSNSLQTAGDEFGGATVSQLSVLDFYTEGLTISAVAGDGTLAPAGSISGLDLVDDGDDATFAGTGTLEAINEMLADGITYAPDLDTPPLTDMVTVTIDDGHDTDSLHFIFNVTGENPTLFGTQGKDIIYATEGYDQFVFAATNGSGRDTIINFTPGQDQIELDYVAFDPGEENGFTSWLANHATATAIGADVLIDLNVDGEHPNQDTILLRNVSLLNLSANDFILPSGGVGN